MAWRPDHYQCVRSVAIIGGGVAGMKACESLVAEGLDVTVFDMYTNKFEANSKMSPYLRMGTMVTRAEMRQDGTPGWVVHFEGVEGQSNSMEVDMLLVCTGRYTYPSVPEVDGMDDFEGRIIHSHEYQGESEGRDKKVVVVGFGKSAQDIALVSSRVSASTTLVYRKPHWPALLGFIPLNVGLFSRFASRMLPAYMRPSYMERFLHSLGYPLVWGFWRLLELILKLQLSLSACDMVPTEPVENDVFTGGFVPHPNFYPSVKKGKIRGERTFIKKFREKSVVLDNGKELKADVVCFATGWQKDYPFFDEDIMSLLEVEEDGHYLYRHMLHPGLPQLAFIGSNVSTFQNLLTQSLQVRWVTELLCGTLLLPGRAAMTQEVEDMKEWKRSFIPSQPSRGAMLQLHLLHYHDELLQDIEIRKHLLRRHYVKEDYDGACFARGPATEFNAEVSVNPDRPAPSPTCRNWLTILLSLPFVLVFWVLSFPFLARVTSGRPKLPMRAPVYSKDGVHEQHAGAKDTEDRGDVQVVADDRDSEEGEDSRFLIRQDLFRCLMCFRRSCACLRRGYCC